MAEITAALVKQLREITDAGMMECKKALVEVNGDLEAAIEHLRKTGLAKAAKKADRSASEGTISIKISSDFKKATISEINSETDFVAQNEAFQTLASKATDLIYSEAVSSVEELMSKNIDGTTFEEYIKTQISKIGENIVIRRFETLSCDKDCVFNGYIHSNNKVGVLVGAKCDSQKTADTVRETLREIAMHAAAMKPKYLDESAIDEEAIEKEKEIAKAQLLQEGKPENMLEKILPGKIKKFYEENTLVNQKFVKDDKKSIKQVLDEAAKSAGGNAELIAYVRYELGEGIEKKACDFASEVAAQLG